MARGDRREHRPVRDKGGRQPWPLPERIRRQVRRPLDDWSAEARREARVDGGATREVSSDISDDLFMAAVEATLPDEYRSLVSTATAPRRARHLQRGARDGTAGEPVPTKARKLGLKGGLECCTSCTRR